MQNTYAANLQYDILKTQKRINVDNAIPCISSSANSHCNFHTSFMYHELYVPMCIFTLNFPCLYFLFYPSKSIIDAVNQMIHPCFRSMSIIGQLNVQVPMDEKEK